LRDRAANGDLLGLMLSDTRDPTQHLTYLAERSEITKEAGEAYLVMRQGQIVRSEPKSRNEGSRIIQFDRYVIDLSVLAPKGHGEPPKPHARYLSELLNPDPADHFYKSNPLSYRTELHERLATLLYPFAFLMIAVAFVGQARSNRQGRNNSLIAAFCLAIGLRLGGMAATNLAMRDANAAWLMYAMPLTGIVLGCVIAWRGMRPAAPSRVRSVAGRLLVPFKGLRGSPAKLPGKLTGIAALQRPDVGMRR
jgi:lipopolysaccharide export system permease protein